MFLGEHEHNVDDKSRLAIPADFRDSCGEGLILTRGYERCIAAYPLSTWMKLAERLASLPQTRSSNRRLNRAAFANAFRRDLDKQGRIVLPPALREWAEIGDEVMVVGLLNHMEIWSRARWAEERSQMDEGAWQLAEELDPSVLGR